MRKAIIAIVLQLAACSTVSAATYYTAFTGGSDARSCATAQTLSTPKRTINSGISCLSPGDTLLVRNGTYDEVLSSFPQGTSIAYIHIAAYPGEFPLVKPTGSPEAVLLMYHGAPRYIEFDGINLDGEFTTNSTVEIVGYGAGSEGEIHHIRLKNLEIQSAGIAVDTVNNSSGQLGFFEFQNLNVHRCGDTYFLHCFYIKSNNTTIENSNIWDYGGGGIHFYSNPDFDTTTMHGNIARNNRIHDNHAGSNQSWGIIDANNSDQALIYNNIIYNLNGNSGADVDGIAAFAGTTAHIWNNTIVGSPDHGIHVYGGVTATDIKNNIIVGATTSAYFNEGTSTSCSFMLSDSSLSGCTSSFASASPSFVDSGINDYNLQSGSAAIDVGTNTGISTDYAGASRPFNSIYDIGAFEFIGDTDPIIPVSHATGTVIVTESFTGSTGTNLSLHTGEVGATWTVHPATSANIVLTDANRIRANAIDQSNIYYASGQPTTPDYDVEGDIRVQTLVDLHYPALLGRYSTTLKTGYGVQYNFTNLRWEIFKWIDNETFLVRSKAATLSVATTYHIILLMRGCQMTLEVDSVQIIQADDCTVPSAGKGGVSLYAGSVAATNSTSFQIDNFSVRQTNIVITDPRIFTRLRFKR